MSIIEKRFWAKVRKSLDCWEWTGCKNSDGYGQFGFRGKVEGSHRVSYILANGDIPKGMCVCHSCDNRGCVNPAHLWLGSQIENIRDRDAKNRGGHGVNAGESGPNSRLRSEDVLIIRDLCAHGFKQRDCAKLWGVHPATINDLVLRKTWSNI